MRERFGICSNQGHFGELGERCLEIFDELDAMMSEVGNFTLPSV
jgi:hypothetical protein